MWGEGVTLPYGRMTYTGSKGPLSAVLGRRPQRCNQYYITFIPYVKEIPPWNIIFSLTSTA